MKCLLYILLLLTFSPLTVSASIYGYQDDTGATHTGAAYVFNADTGALLSTLTNPSPGNADYF